jgi:hypothetical protein
VQAGEADKLTTDQQIFNGETGRTFEKSTGFAFGETLCNPEFWKNAG